MKKIINRPGVSAVICLTHHDGSLLEAEEQERFVQKLIISMLETIELPESEATDY